jgi:hypothetical protein
VRFLHIHIGSRKIVGMLRLGERVRIAAVTCLRPTTPTPTFTKKEEISGNKRNVLTIFTHEIIWIVLSTEIQ